MIWKIICPRLSVPCRKCRLPEQAEFVCNLLSLGWTGNSCQSIISIQSSNNSMCTWRVTVLYLPQSSAESQGCHSLVISWGTLLFSLVGEREVRTCAGDWILGNFCLVSVSRRLVSKKNYSESLQLGYLMLWELSCFTQLSWFLCDTVCVPCCRLFWCRAGVKTLQCSCLSSHMVLTDCMLKIDENISSEQIL